MTSLLSEGPLDLLWELVRKEQVPIEDISIARVASQFLAYVETAGRLNIDLSGEWMEMTARLILWKSRSLLPRDPALARSEPDTRAELIALLHDHAERAADALARRKEAADAVFSRGGGEEAAEETEGFTLGDLIRLCEQHASDAKQLPIYRVEPEEADMDETMAWIRARLREEQGKVTTVDMLFGARPALTQKIYVFLGLLELAQSREVELSQSLTTVDVIATVVTK